jgi:hypothetical protein
MDTDFIFYLQAGDFVIPFVLLILSTNEVHEKHDLHSKKYTPLQGLLLLLVAFAAFAWTENSVSTI